MKLHLATDFSLPAEAVTQTFAILAKRGAGKTYTAAVMTEEFLEAGQQVVVADPVGVWWGLRTSADGKAPGFAIVVFGGEHADVPLQEESGELIAQAIVEHGFSAVLDLSLLRKNAQVRFMTAFAEALYRLNRKPLHLMVDEADAFAPQRPMRGEERLLGAFEDIVRRGRARGLGVTLITQRAAVLNKNVLTQIEVLVCLRTISPQDREAIAAWTEIHGTEEQLKDFNASLASLPIGTAWFWSPGWLNAFKLIEVRKRITFDSSATPKAGAKPIQPTHLAPVDLAKLGERIAATVDRAKENDPGLLKRQLAEAKRELKVLQDKAARVDARPTRTETKVLEKPVLKEKQLERVEIFAERLERWLKELLTALKAVAPQSPIGNRQPPIRSLDTTVEQLTGLSPQDWKRVTRERRAPARLGGGLKRMLAALAQRPQGLSAKQLGVRAGLSSRSGTFGTYLGQLRANGWASGERGLIHITAEGQAALGEFEPLPEGRALFDYWMGQFGVSGAARLLEVLYHHGPMDAEAAAEKAELSASSGTFGTYLGKLRSLELVSGSRDALKCSEELYD